jgi:hypothetical protein
VNPYKRNKSLDPIKKSLLVFTQGEAFSVGDPFLYLVRRSSSARSIKQCENLLLIPKTWETDNNAYADTHLQDPYPPSLPPKGKKKRKKRKKKLGLLGACCNFPLVRVEFLFRIVSNGED